MYLFDPELQLTNTKSMIKNKLREFLCYLKKFKIQTILILEHKKNHKIFYSSVKLIASDSDIDETFKSMHQSIMTKNKIQLAMIGLSQM